MSAHPPKELSPASVFFARRACRTGSARRRDFIECFPAHESPFRASQTTYTRWIDDAMHAAACLVRRGERGPGVSVVLSPGENIPRWAGFDSLLREIESGNDPAITGLSESELPVHIARWTNNDPLDPNALRAITLAIAGACALTIRYVSYRIGDEGRDRFVLPYGLERMGDQWRLLALDLEKPGYPMRVFTLARIVRAAVESIVPAPKGATQPGVHSPAYAPKGRFDRRLNNVQREVLAHELGMVNGRLNIEARSRFEFLVRFAAQKPSPDVVWPPLVNSGDDDD